MAAHGPLLAQLARATGAHWLDVLDAAWLVGQGRRATVPEAPAPGPNDQPPEAVPDPAPPAPEEPPETHPAAPPPQARPAARLGLRAPGQGRGGRAVPVPLPPPLTEGRAYVRALRPLRQRTPSRHRFDLDETATVGRIAALDLWEPVLRPRSEPAADLVLVIDQGGAWPVLRRRVRALVSLLERLGAFRTVRLTTLDHARPSLLHGGMPSARAGAPVQAGRLADPSGRRRVLVISDLTGPAWWDGRAAALLARWPRPTIVHPLDPGLWTRTAFGRALSPATLADLRSLGDHAPVTARVPVTALDPDAITRWLAAPRQGWHLPLDAAPPPGASEPEDRLAAFLAHRSAPARRLALALAVVPSPWVTPQLLSLVGAAAAPEARERHEAELWVSGLLEVLPGQGALAVDGRRYRFRGGIRAGLAQRVPRTEALRVNLALRRWLESHWGQAAAFFAALLDGRGAAAVEGGVGEDGAFAEVARELLQRFEVIERAPKEWRGARFRRLLTDLGERVPPKKDVVRVVMNVDALHGVLADLVERHRDRKQAIVEAAVDLQVLPGTVVRRLVFADGTASPPRPPDLSPAGLHLSPFTLDAPEGEPLIAQWGPAGQVRPADWASVLRLARTRCVLPIIEDPQVEAPPGLSVRRGPNKGSLVAELLRRRPVHVPIVALSGHKRPEIDDHLAAGGAFATHAKVQADLDLGIERRSTLDEPPVSPAEGTVQIEIDGPLVAPLRWPAHSRELDRQLGLPERLVPGSIVHTAPGGIQLAYVPAGTFWMGSPEGVGHSDEHPRHKVTLTRPFLVGVTPVTQAQWRAVAAAAGLPAAPSSFTGDDLPVEQVSWEDAARWCEALTKADADRGALTKDAYRLPTEAEWEYFGRAGTDTAWSFGDAEAALAEHAWYNKNAGRTTHPVGQLRPNPWGLYDVHGNVREWCGDGWSSIYQDRPPEDPFVPPAPGGRRVIRGGSWDYSAVWCRSAYRYYWNPGNRVDDVGFRVVLPLPRGS